MGTGSPLSTSISGKRAGPALTGHRAEFRHGGQQRFRIGTLRVGENLFGFSTFDRFPLVHDDRTVGDLGDDAHVVGDEEDAHSLFFLQQLDQFKDLCLDRHVQRRGRLVGDQQPRTAGERHGNHDALAHTAGKLMRIFLHALSRRRDTDLFHQPQRLLCGRAEGKAAMGDEHFGDLLADRQRRIEAGHRLLKDHRDPVAANVAHFPFRQCQKVLPLEPNLTFNAACIWLVEPHH